MYVKRPQHDWNLHLPETQPPRKRQARGRRSPKLSAAAQRYDPKGWVMELLNEFTYIYIYIYILIWLYIYGYLYIYISVVVTSLIHVWVGSCYISYRNL